MLFHLLYSLHEHFSFLNVFKYITFRTFGAGLTALFINFLLGHLFIQYFKKEKVEQMIRDDGPATHFSKQGTPTMGGLLILGSLILSTLLWADLSNTYIWCILFLTVSFGCIGFVDDYLKLTKKNTKGLPGKLKLTFQTFFSLLAVYWLYQTSPAHGDLTFPFFKHLLIEMGWVYIPFAILVIVGTSNAVNLTDGLDGLAIGPIMTTAGTYLLFAYIAGHSQIAQYLQVAWVPGAGELSIFCAALVMSSLGFLWYSSYPAAIFMGDVGSLSLGGALGMMAVLVRQELLLFLVGGIFVLEAVSVIGQVLSYKTRRKRIFKMAPIHHHFEISGWAEPKIVVRFWIISIVLAIMALATLKLR